MPLRLERLPPSWLDKPQYRPRVRGGASEPHPGSPSGAAESSSTWAPLAPALGRLAELPVAPASEPVPPRSALVAAVREVHARWELPLDAAAARSLALLERPETSVVVAGQQPGLLGGPLLVLLKALGAIASARAAQARIGRPVVPVFWVASEDHDLDEVRAAVFPSGSGEVELAYPGESDRRPLSERRFGPEALAVLATAKERLGGRRFGDEAARLIDLCASRSLPGGFAAILTDLLAGTGLLIIAPEALRPWTRGLVRRVIEDPRGTLEAIERGRERVAALGVEPYVAARLPLFLVEDGLRHHLSPGKGSDELSLDGLGERRSRKQLLELLESSPERFSTGALLRPFAQDHVLPALFTVGGPAEVGYFAQLPPLAEMLGAPAPRIALRPQATLIDGKAARLAASLPLEALARARRPEDLVVLPEAAPLIAALGPLEEDVRHALLEAVRVHAPPSERARMARRGEEIAAGVASLRAKLEAGRARERSGELARAERLWSTMHPGGELQERRWGYLHLVSRHGRGWIRDLLEAIAADPLSGLPLLGLFEDGDDDPPEAGDSAAAGSDGDRGERGDP